MKHLRSVSMCLATSVCLVTGAGAQTVNGEWRSYGGDPGSTKYAPLDQINRTNVKNLRIAWRRPAVDPLLSGKDPKLRVPNNFRATPLMIGGVLYSPNGVGLVEAFDPGTGKTIWIRSLRLVRRRCAVPALEAWRTGATAATNASSCSEARH